MTHIFIINPVAGQSGLTENLRERLSRINGLNYYVFTTRYAGYEREIVRKVLHFFRGEKLRFYCCGGSGTMRNMLCGFNDLAEAEVSFYPCGITNDFLKMFGSDAERFRDIEELINGDIISVDYIKTNCGPALNTISFGIDSEVTLHMDDYRFLRIFNSSAPYNMAIVHALLLSKQYSYDITIDGQQAFSAVTSEAFFGNGNVLGGNLHITESDSMFDGIGGYMVAPKLDLPKEVKMLLALIKSSSEHINKVCSCGRFQSFGIRRTDGSQFILNFDGELQNVEDSLEAEIVRRGLRFVVPKGIKGVINNE